eukprot:Em0019g212a
MAETAGTTISKPRTVKRQTLRGNVDADTPEIDYRQTMYLPFVDGIIQQLSDLFPQLTLRATRGLLLIPSNLEKLTDKSIIDIMEYYEPDLFCKHSFIQEVRLWKRQWSADDNLPSANPSA